MSEHGAMSANNTPAGGQVQGLSSLAARKSSTSVKKSDPCALPTASSNGALHSMEEATLESKSDDGKEGGLGISDQVCVAPLPTRVMHNA